MMLHTGVVKMLNKKCTAKSRGFTITFFKQGAGKSNSRTQCSDWPSNVTKYKPTKA